MRYIVMIGVAVLLAGCADYSSIKEREPIHSGHTAKRPEQVVNCVIPKWMETNPSTHAVPDGDSTIIVAPVGNGFVSLTLTIGPSGEVAMRSQPSLSTFDKQWEQAQSCL